MTEENLIQKLKLDKAWRTIYATQLTKDGQVLNPPIIDGTSRHSILEIWKAKFEQEPVIISGGRIFKELKKK